MKTFPLPPDQSADPSSPIKKIIDNASGIELTLANAPTSQANGLKILPKHGDTGHVGTTIYKNLNGQIVKISGALV